MSTFFIGLS